MLQYQYLNEKASPRLVVWDQIHAMMRKPKKYVRAYGKHGCKSNLAIRSAFKTIMIPAVSCKTLEGICLYLNCSDSILCFETLSTKKHDWFRNRLAETMDRGSGTP